MINNKRTLSVFVDESPDCVQTKVTYVVDEATITEHIMTRYYIEPRFS